jgi:tetratricopeptide (TPR) repeat protein
MGGQTAALRIARATMPYVPGLEIPASLTRKQVLRSAKISPQQLAAWERAGLIPRKDAYEQSDLLLLSNVRTLRESGVSPTGIKKLGNALRRRFPEVPEPLRDLRLHRRGKRLAVYWQGAEMEARSGQLLLALAPAELQVILSFPDNSSRNKKNQEAVRKQEAADTFFRALERENQGAPISEVVAIYKQALALDAECFGAHLNLGTIYFNQKKLKLAEQHYKAAIALHPSYVLAHFNLASLYDEMGQFEKAIQFYHSTLALDADYVDAHYNLALLLQSLGRTMEATRHWKRFLKLDPQGEWANIARRELQRLLDATVVPGGARANRVKATRRSASQAG